MTRTQPSATHANLDPETEMTAPVLSDAPSHDAITSAEPEPDDTHASIPMDAGDTGEPEAPMAEQPGRRFPTLADMVAKAPSASTPEEVPAGPPREPQLPEPEPPLRQPDQATAHASSQADATWSDGTPPPGALRVPRRQTAPPDKGQATPHTAFSRPPLDRSRVRPLPEVHLALPVAGLHAGIAAIGALIGAGLLIGGSAYAFWVLALSAISGIGAGLAYLFGQQRGSYRLAGTCLLVSELGILIWANVVLGGADALLVVGVAVVLVALRTIGRGGAIVAAVSALAIQTTFDIQHAYAPTPAAFSLAPVAYAIVSGSLTAIGLLCVVWLAMGLFSGRAKHEHAASARQYELHALRTHTSQTQLAQEENIARLQKTLDAVLQGGLPERPDVEGSYNALASGIVILAERLRVLQREREVRLRLEGAVRRLTNTMERAWLGLEWTWPPETGTPLDELVAVLREPGRVTDREPVADELPTLVPMPTPDPTFRTLRPDAHDLPEQTVPEISAGQVVNDEAGVDLNDDTASGPPHSLPWHEWDAWRQQNLADDA